MNLLCLTDGTDGTNTDDRLCFAFTADAVKLAIGADVKAKILRETILCNPGLLLNGFGQQGWKKKSFQIPCHELNR